jgi:hypothetical protein
MVDQNKKYKRFVISHIYRGYTHTRECTAKSAKEAAEKLDCSLSFINKYGMKTTVNEPIDGVVAYIDSGYIPFEYGRKDLLWKIMLWDELKSIIDFYVDEKYKDFKRKLQR